METSKLTDALKAAIIPAALGFAMWKMGGNNLVKAMGAGVLGVTAVSAARQVTNI